MTETLTPETIRKELPSGWTYDGDTIHRTYEFETYLGGVEFATDVARLADEAFHHPKMTIEFRSVTVSFTNHEAGGVTEQDLELATRVEEL